VFAGPLADLVPLPKPVAARPSVLVPVSCAPVAVAEAGLWDFWVARDAKEADFKLFLVSGRPLRRHTKLGGFEVTEGDLRRGSIAELCDLVLDRGLL
jgi:hypothetical protein